MTKERNELDMLECSTKKDHRTTYNRNVEGGVEKVKYIRTSTSEIRDTPPEEQDEEWTRYAAKANGKVTWVHNETGNIWRENDITNNHRKRAHKQETRKKQLPKA